MSGRSKITDQSTNVSSDETIDFSDSPPITEERASKGWVRLPDGTRIVPVKMDLKTFQWYLSQGKDCTHQMEAALRDYAATHNAPLS